MVKGVGVGGGRGLSLGFLSVEARISGQIDHVAASEFPCQSALNINDSARKTEPRERTGGFWGGRVIEAGANLDPVLVAPAN